MSRVIGVLSGKGGVGKTTIVANLGAALTTKFNKKVTVVDCNLTTSHLGMHFGIFHYPKTFNDYLRGDTPLSEVAFPHTSGVNLIPASMNLSELIGVDMSNIGEKLNEGLENEDFVILDIAPGFGKEAISGIKACQEALLVTTPDLPSVTDIVRAKDVLNELNVKVLGVIVNKRTGKKFDLTTNEVADITGLPVIGSVPFKFEVVESLANKTPLVLYRPASTASVEMFKIAATIAEEKYTPPKNLLTLITEMFAPKR